ncbi:MAG: GNAT family N-acetyltransferase [Cytophagaceae bacterium]|nr:GNAT family N-acetyltransferase [Cytophagaceae bacterium]
MMPNVQIREIDAGEIPVIQGLVNAIWGPTYGGILTEEQSGFMLDWMYSDQALASQFAQNNHFLLLTVDDEPTGFASFQEGSKHGFKLHKIYLLPTAQGRGWGRMLLDDVKARIVESGGLHLDLNVNRGNTARFFYEKLSFSVLREEDNYIGRGYWMNDYVMRLSLEGNL